MKAKEKATCHPDKPRYAKGLCKRCYSRTLFRAKGGRKRKMGICIRCCRERGIVTGGRCNTCYLIVRKESIKTRLLKEQGHRCAILGCSTDTSKYTLADWRLDHDHRCGGENNWCEKCIRGVICRQCNFVLGLCGDSIDCLRGLISYLEKAEAK